VANILQLATDVRSAVLSLNPEDVTTATAQIVESTLDARALKGFATIDEGATKTALHSELFGFGQLDQLLTDPLVEELWINNPSEVIFVREGIRGVLPINLDAATLRTMVLRMLRDTGRRIDTSLPFADAMLPDGSRLHVVIPDVTAEHWSVNIRKFPPQVLTLDDLLESKTLTAAQFRYLTDAASAGHNILFSGATHSGKTTMLGATLSALPEHTRLISCEETFELRTTLTDWVAMQARQPNLEGQGEIPLRRLVKESLRMRPDRLVIGEVREAEALDLLVAMNSGVAGACTIHANSARAAISKMCTLPLLAGPNISADFVRSTVGNAIDVVVHCKHLGGGRRVVAEIAEVFEDADGFPIVKDAKL
jgi:pilus assembly protein CpaF